MDKYYINKTISSLKFYCISLNLFLKFQGYVLIRIKTIVGLSI